MAKISGEKIRCFGDQDKLLAEYHDNEWGIPVHNDRHLFEMLVLEGAQAGLNWQMVLKKREDYRKLFHHFDPIKVAAMSDEDLNSLLKNPKIIRNRLKIYSARRNAQVFIKIQEEFGSFDKYIWQFVNNKSIVNNWKTIKDLPATSPESEAISKDLKKRGMTFVGPTIIYAFMQAVGLVNDHIVTCWRYKNVINK